MFKGSFDRMRSVKATTAVVAAAVLTFVSVGEVKSGYVVAEDFTDTYKAVSAMRMHEVVSNKSAGFGELETVASLEMAHTVKGDKIYEQAMGIASSVFEISNLEIRKAEELQRIAEEEQAAIKAEEERKAAEEAARKAAEEEAKRIAEEEARRIAEEEACRIAEEEQVVTETVPEAVPSTSITYTYNVPIGANSAFKAYMSYRAVTCKSSPQYKLLNHELAYTDQNTGIRMYDGRYCIAMGSGYTTLIGQKIDLYLESGVVIPCILGDCKADCHTNWDTHQYCVTNGSVAEFIVDNSVFGYLKDGSGTVNWCVGECGSFAGEIVSVVLVD